MQRSAHRLALPELPTDWFVGSIKALIDADRAWVPHGDEKSLYIRPFMFASERFLGVRPAQHVTYSVIASPAAAYFPGGVKPVSIWLSTEYARAGAGGTGAAKMRRQLRVEPAAPAGGRRARLRAGGVPRLRRAPLGRGAGRHEPLLRPVRRVDRHPVAVRLDPPGHHPRLDHHPGPRSRATKWSNAGSASTSGATAAPTARSPRCSRAERPRSSPRCVRSSGMAARRSACRRRGRQGHARHPFRAHRHPVRPRRGPAPLDDECGSRLSVLAWLDEWLARAHPSPCRRRVNDERRDAHRARPDR